MKTIYNNTYDTDAHETQEWVDAYTQVLQHGGQKRGQLLLGHLQQVLQCYQMTDMPESMTPILHNNTVMPCAVPEDIAADRRRDYRAYIRWNAVVMVLRAQQRHPELGGHIATCMSIADMYDVAYEYFFQGASAQRLADCVFFQGHSSPLIYARSYLEGRLSATQLDHFRQESKGLGLSSYPHPYLMPHYWQFPTVSMGLGILQAIHLARVLKYLDNRKLLPLGDRRVWVYAGDGEMREPESLSGLMTAAVDRLSQLTMVINANLQGLDGLCRGNGSVVRELEGIFRGAGWRVIKLVWNQAWLDLCATDPTGDFAAWLASWVDGDHQNFYLKGEDYLLQAWSLAHPEHASWLMAHRDYIPKLLPGGHDHALLYQAYQEAVAYTAGPSVIIAQTIKGHGLPMSAQNFAHQHKKMQEEDLSRFAATCRIPLDSAACQAASYYRPEPLQTLRRSLTPLPERSVADIVIDVPDCAQLRAAVPGHGVLSTTASFVRVLSALLRNKALKERIVPIVADEARTFGMEGLFQHIGVYHATAVQFTSHDAGSLTGYRESTQGQLLQEGIHEAGAMATWIACATSYSVNHYPLLPFYIFYSMFGFQRVMDMIWSAADSRARGFLLGATAGRTTLAGEGLQHADGHSILLAQVVPSVVCYDPAWHEEVVVIVQYWMEKMLVQQQDVIVYMTLVNEGVQQQALPDDSAEGVVRGMYRYAHQQDTGLGRPTVHLLGSGALFHQVYAVYEMLCTLGVGVAVYSVTSYGVLRHAAAADAQDAEHPVLRYLSEAQDIVVAVSDYVGLVPDMIRPYVRGDYTVCGTDGFGMSDTRAALREHFGVDAASILRTVLQRMLVKNVVDSACVDAWLLQLGMSDV